MIKYLFENSDYYSESMMIITPSQFDMLVGINDLSERKHYLVRKFVID